MHTERSLLIGTCAIAVLVSLATAHSRPKRKFDGRLSILSQCRFFKTRMLVQSCYGIARNPSLVKMTGVVRQNEYATSTTESVPTTESPRRSVRMKFQRWQKGATSTLGCRTHLHCDEFLPDSIKNENLRSLSPWDHCNHHDPDRFPQDISEAVCLCKSCIDLDTGWPTNDGYSKPISVPIIAMYKDKSVPSFDLCTDETCYETVLNVDVACHCVRIALGRTPKYAK